MKLSLFRFAIVGLLNTVIDLAIYTFLRSRDVDIAIANLCSTTAALAFSFMMNRRYTFRSHGAALRHQVIRFVPITLAGLWILQPIFIHLFTSVDNAMHYSDLLPISNIEILIPKLAATIITLIWNFVWYRNYVFRDKA